MKKNSILQSVILISLLLITQNLFSQTNTSPFQTVCAGSLAEPYLMNPPTLGSSYQWTLTGGGTINNGLTSDNITVDWGSTPGTYTLTVIETDVNGCIGDPVTLDITVSPLPSATVGTSQTACVGSIVPDLFAIGANVNWYSDPALINNVFTGNSFPTGQTLPGIYTYYVTESLNGCEGVSIPVTLEIFQLPSSPISSDASVCEGALVPDLFAIGANVNWYSDPALTTNVFTGNSFSTGQTLPGLYTYYVTNSQNGCESVATSVDLTINATPAGPISIDETVCEGVLVPNLFAAGTNINWYSDPALTTNVFTGNSFSTGQTLPGLYTYYVTNSQNGCESVATSVDLTINATPAGPISSDETVCEGGLVPDLSATGTLVNWYSDAALTNNVFSGNIFVTGQVLPNVYTYYVTNSQNGCESVPVSVDLTINPKPVTGPISHW
jgi:hypothetical protein